MELNTGYIAFALYTLIIIAGGILAIFSRSIIRSLIGLIVILFGVAGMYFLMAAPFMALMQVMIYVGAVVVLIFFAIMLTGVEGNEGFSSSRLIRSIIPAGLAALVLILTISGSRINFTSPEELPLKELGKSLLSTYMLPFELISIVLFIAMAGAVVLGFERRREKE